MPHLSVRHWVVAGLSATGAVVLALAAFSWNFARQTLEASTFVNHTQQVIGGIAVVRSEVERAEAAQRAYLMTRRGSDAAERDQTLARVDAAIGDVMRSTIDNAAQQDRVAEIRRLMLARSNLARGTDPALRAGDAPVDLVARLDEGTSLLTRVRILLDAMSAEEHRLLAERSRQTDEQSGLAGALFASLIVLMLLSLPLVYWRARRELEARERAERLVAQVRRHEELHARALTLYNNHPDRQGMIVDGTLEVLASDPKYLCSAFYVHETLGGVLRLAGTHAAPSDTQPIVRLGEGPVGMAGRSQQMVEVPVRDGSSGFRIEGGLTTLVPTTLLASPVMYQGQLCGVLVLAAAEGLDDNDRRFVDRLCSQWGVALHNLSQVAELNLLAEQLRARGEDIQLKNAELRKADRMKSEFLANMSHELRTPLNAVIGFSEILKDGMVGDLTAEQVEYITDIFTSGKHLLSLINDILDLSKVESGHTPLELEPLDPGQLSGAGMSVMREKASTQHVRLTAVCAPDQGSLMVDVRKAKQIVYNLLANAVKFTPDGGHVNFVLAKVPAATVQERCDQRGARAFCPPDIAAFPEWLSISVTDTGIGIAPEDLQRLFQPFVQIDSSLSRKFSGTGLGLMMVKRLTELHGGAVVVTSIVDQGSTFSVFLPWRPVSEDQLRDVADVTGRAVMAPAAGGRGDGPRVLVVEDDPRASEMIVGHLSENGYQVEVARTAEEGLQIASRRAPAVIVLDIILPGIDGWDMLLTLRDDEKTRHIPVVIVSVTDERRRGFALGASQVLAKPVDAEDLLAAVASVHLDGRGATGLRVLVVDDDPKAVTLVSKHLESVGFSPIGAYGGAEALDLVRAEAPALVVLDLMMPGLSGFDVVRAMRADPATADIPVIVLTAKLLTAEDRVLLGGQVQQVLEKSEFLPASLLAEVRRALARRRTFGDGGWRGCSRWKTPGRT